MILRSISIICVFIYASVIHAEPLPGIDPYDAHLDKKLKKALLAKGENYKPRTKHLSDKGQAHYTNRLILEDSPYLTQHAHNPVNWFPWGDKTLKVNVQLADNWHINAHQSKVDDIIPTSIYIDTDYPAFRIDNITYPEPINRKFSFLNTILKVYEGDVTLRGLLNVNKNAKNTAHGNALVPVVIQFQACNDQICLAPEKLTFRVAQ